MENQMAKPVRPTPKPRRKRVITETVVEPKVKKSKPVVAAPDDIWQEKKPRKTHKTNKFCVDCLDVETCVKEKLAMVIHCMDRRV
jgi:hypothetical protein